MDILNSGTLYFRDNTTNSDFVGEIFNPTVVIIKNNLSYLTNSFFIGENNSQNLIESSPLSFKLL